MKILIIGGQGTIGSKVKARLALTHDVISAGRSSGDITVDFSNSQSISQMFDSMGKVDAIVAIAGEAKWDKFDN
ncbi:MAG: sugar nucleotide-binding protein, partial [Bacteroidia bacterium]|nr:sugar nucleotide-binding protein [Bacteroidia bacterium]